MTELEVVLRILAAAAVGFLIGVERSRRIRFVGARTFALIATAGAMAGVVAMRLHSEDARVISTVLQGVLTGVGFVGAGVIMHPACGRSIHGVTTAAAIWVAALAGFAAGLGEWLLMAVGAGLTFVVLMAPEPFGPRPDRPDEAKDEPPCG
ncbi:MAG: MgtC/SapB family protein [Phenylobacterium sp.]|uniref:MgtC/SapB family protein n=1 Tax=Phenylobacterium sp. TaxID=1871053 RepID=UPI001210C70A|nr:MgtC/SapB family protein [Phenylobacterium sp.]TAJ71755.1 MAG: MgtC/SapB family protein [Phenylobacterium sp.]